MQECDTWVSVIVLKTEPTIIVLENLCNSTTYSVSLNSKKSSPDLVLNTEVAKCPTLFLNSLPLVSVETLMHFVLHTERWQEGPSCSGQGLLPPHPAHHADHGAALLLHGGTTSVSQ